MKAPLFFFAAHVFMSPEHFTSFQAEMVGFFQKVQPLLEQLSVGYDHVSGLATLTVTSKTDIDEKSYIMLERFITTNHLNNYSFYANKQFAKNANYHFGVWLVKVDNFQANFARFLEEKLSSLYRDSNVFEVKVQPLFKKYVLLRVVSYEVLGDKTLTLINNELSEFLKLSTVLS